MRKSRPFHLDHRAPETTWKPRLLQTNAAKSGSNSQSGCIYRSSSYSQQINLCYALAMTVDLLQILY
ncbi:hypothetical protein DYI23_08570 [Roseibium polysiphoniae]|uniref:Uncharacterized protein n=1 Tax=Roseibium polysiphoniae TaxID=2571221 RepID=A0A944CE36_9HYPH|nr:hypothetical protein [Roseibium polysiphoniae]